MIDHHCPRCKSQAFLFSHKSILVSFQNWPYALASLGALTIFCIATDCPPNIFTFGAVLAVLPLLAKFITKHFCEKCGIEFRDERLKADGAGS